MNHYSWNAEDYERHSRAQQVWARELIAKLQLTGSEAVLDLGCGDGKVTAEIAAAVKQGSVIGVDSSPAMIDLASRRYPSNQLPNLGFQLMDATALDFNADFDVVFSNAALHWVRGHRPVVEGLYHSLRPGGRILLQMGGKGNAVDILAVLDEVIAEAQWQAYFTDFDFPYGFYDTDEYMELLTDAGFTARRIELIPKDMVHEGRVGLEGWIRTTWLPYTQRLPDQCRDAFVAEIASRYLDRVPIDEQGRVHVAMVRIEIEADRRDSTWHDDLTGRP